MLPPETIVGDVTIETLLYEQGGAAVQEVPIRVSVSLEPGALTCTNASCKHTLMAHDFTATDAGIAADCPKCGTRVEQLLLR
jgi:hypothetical protein